MSAPRLPDSLAVTAVCLLAACLPSAGAAVAPAAITIDAGKVVCVSALRLGVTHTHASSDRWNAEPQAARAAEANVARVAAYHNTHIMGWGVGPIVPKPGVWDWVSMDKRMTMMRSLGGEMVITLCSAPGWMKVGGKDWDMGARVAPEFVGEFVEMAIAVARRYPDVRHYQVWNEFKGFWDSKRNRWDAESYTAFYNEVYDALKAHDPALKVGGFYLVVSGTGSQGRVDGVSGDPTLAPLTSKDRALLEYWLKNKHGADFLCLDHGTLSYHDQFKKQYRKQDVFAFLDCWLNIGTQVREMTDLPYWWSEYYGGDGEIEEPFSPDEKAALYAEIYRNMVLGGAATALLWNPVEGECQHFIVSDVTRPGGGQPNAHYRVFALFSEHFSRGAQILAARSSDPRLSVLASRTAVLVVNHSPETVEVDLLRARVTLPPFSAHWQLTGAKGRT